MQFFAHHGCFEEEQITGTHFRVDMYIETDTSASELSDDLQDTIDYQAVIMTVREEMEKPSKLLEHVGRRILDRVMEKFPAVEEVVLKVEKLHPPVGGQVDSVSVTFEKVRD